MLALEKKILNEGTVLPGNILKVGSFLNHQIDVGFLFEMADEVKKHFENKSITKILTIETSGIAIAVPVAYKMNVPLVFAKKNKSQNISGDVYSAKIHSYTHGNDYDAVVMKEYLKENDNILIIDDFLANGAAMNGLIDIVNQSGAALSGIGIAIEKEFQGGGNLLREQGIDVLSLAKIKKMTDSEIFFCD